MSSRLRTRKKSIRKQTPDFSPAPAQGMFQSRPFVVQSQTAEKSQQPDLKTALRRAQRYGHHLGQMQPAGVSASKAIQPKLANGQQVESNIVQRVKKAPDRPLSQVEDQKWEQDWAAKQEEVHNAMQAFVPRFQALDPDAEVKIRGSLASGIKGNPSKVDPATGERLLFNPTDFDIDAYVVSDKLYREALEQGGDDANARGQVKGSSHRKVNEIIRDMRKVLATIEGNRDAPHPKNSWKFNVLIRSQRNAKGTITRDRKAMKDLKKPENWGEPLKVERPAQ